MEAIQKNYSEDRATKPAAATTTTEEKSSRSNRSDNYKTCPICGSICFVDMEVCFGCLHRFSECSSLLPPQARYDQQDQLTVPDHPTSSKKPTINKLMKEEVEMPKHNSEPVASSKSKDNDSLLPGQKRNKDHVSHQHICSTSDEQRFEITISIRKL